MLFVNDINHVYLTQLLLSMVLKLRQKHEKWLFLLSREEKK